MSTPGNGTQSYREIIHDLRNHLSSIMMSCEVALLDSHIPVQAKNALASAVEESRRIAVLVEKLSKIEQTPSEK